MNWRRRRGITKRLPDIHDLATHHSQIAQRLRARLEHFLRKFGNSVATMAGRRAVPRAGRYSKLGKSAPDHPVVRMIDEFPARPLYRRAIALTFNLVEPNLRLVVSHPGWTYSNGKQIGRVSPSRAWLLTGRLRAGLSPLPIQASRSRPSISPVDLPVSIPLRCGGPYPRCWTLSRISGRAREGNS